MEGAIVAAPLSGALAKRNLHTMPTELLEMILLACGEQWHFVLSMVCWRWRDIISAWRKRAKRIGTMKTPYVVAVHTIQLASWARQNGCEWNM